MLRLWPTGASRDSLDECAIIIGKIMVGPDRLELSTSVLSGPRSNHLSYGPTRGIIIAFQSANDEGIDGLINDDVLGLDKIYVQAKRWDNNVGRPDIQGFVGALSGRRANKGVFITTSCFTSTARKYVDNIGEQVVLIDGELLAKLMIEYQLGVSIDSSYEIKKLDRDYFEDE